MDARVLLGGGLPPGGGGVVIPSSSLGTTSIDVSALVFPVLALLPFLCAAATASAMLRSLPVPLEPALTLLFAGSISSTALSPLALALPFVGFLSSTPAAATLLCLGLPVHLPRGSSPAALRQVEQTHLPRHRGHFHAYLVSDGEQCSAGLIIIRLDLTMVSGS